MNYLVKVGDQTKKVHVDHLMAAHRDSSSRAAADDWDILPFRSPHKLTLMSQVIIQMFLLKQGLPAADILSEIEDL